MMNGHLFPFDLDAMNTPYILVRNKGFYEAFQFIFDSQQYREDIEEKIIQKTKEIVHHYPNVS